MLIIVRGSVGIIIIGVCTKSIVTLPMTCHGHARRMRRRYSYIDGALFGVGIG